MEDDPFSFVIDCLVIIQSYTLTSPYRTYRTLHDMVHVFKT
jgi:hypothetical protein